jgi:hypothetical protein
LDVQRWAFGVFFAALSSLRPITLGAYVTDLMRSFLRKVCLVLSLGSLLFFLSCERHRVGELPNEQTTETKPASHEHDSHSDQSAATTNTSHTSQTPEPRKSPANFFPDKKKP